MIKSSITKDEYFNMVKKHKSTNASTPEFRKQELDAITAFPVGTKFAFKEDNSWHDVNTVYEKIDDNVWKITQVINGKVNDEYTKSDDEVRIYISDEFGGNAYPTSYVSGYGSINSSKRNNMIKSDKQFRLIDTQHNDPKDGEDFTAEELKDYISKNDKYFDNVGLDYTIVDLNTGEEMNMSTFRLNLSRQIKSSWKQFTKGLDKLEKRDELKDMYNSAHWEFLNYIMPCDSEWTPDMADGDFNPLDEIYSLFKSPSDIEEFLFECAKENLPGAKEKLQRIRQINTCNNVYSSRQIKSAYTREEIVKMSNEGYRAFFDNKKITDCPYEDNSVEKDYWIGGYKGAEHLWNIRESYNPVKSAYTREDYDRFDEVGNFIPYKPTEEELAKKDEIKKALEQELSDAYEPDPMDDYAGYDSTSERMDSAVEEVANQFGVDTDFAWECAGELMNEENARQYEEAEWAQNNLEGDEYDKWYRGELDIRDRIHSSRKPIKSSFSDLDNLASEIYHWVVNVGVLDNLSEEERNDMDVCADEIASRIRYPEEYGYSDESPESANRFVKAIKDKLNNDKVLREEIGWDETTTDERTPQEKWEDYNWSKGDTKHLWDIKSSRKLIKSSIITPWDTNQVTGTSDEDLGLSAVVDMYGNEFVNVDESTLNELKDTLVRYFDDEAYVRDWNINNPDYQIEDAFEVTDPEEMSAEDLARYFDYEAYGRDIRLEDNMVWDSENQYWVSAHDVDDEELNDDKYIFMRG